MNFTPVRNAALFACALIAAPALASGTLQDAEEPETEAAASEKEAAEDAEAPEAKPQAKEEKRICRRVRLDMSSRRATRVCKTADEWREFNQRR